MNLLLPDVAITFYHIRESNQLQYLSEQGDFVYCTDIESLLNYMSVGKNGWVK